MIEILKLQYEDNFVGREEETKELKEKIEKNGIVVITGGRGIGKTNLIKVVEKDFENQKECHHIEYSSLFSSEVSRIFLPDKILTGASGGFIVSGGISWKPREPSVLEYMEKSEEKMIFVENAHELKEMEIETIFVASRRNERLRFILEIATHYKPDVKLDVDSYEVVELKGLSDNDIGEIVRRECPNFSDVIVKRIVFLSQGYPYVARSLVYICDKKNTEEEIFEFLKTLKADEMRYNLDQIHKEVLKTLNEDSQEFIKKLAIAPPILTLNLIVAFCGNEVDTPLTDIKERGILVESEEFYRIYHPLFREYLRHIQPIVLKNKKEIYYEAMEEVKSEFDSIYMLFEVIDEPNIFKELIKQTENYNAINSVGIQSYRWGRLEQAFYAWNHLLEKTIGVDKEREAIAMGNMGVVYQIKGELKKALEYYERALKLLEELGIKEGIAAAAITNIGNVYNTKGELEKALEYYEKALKLFEELEIKEGIATVLINIGNVYRSKGELDKALEHYEKALKLDVRLGIKGGIARDLGYIGNVYNTKGELDKALEYCEKALKLDEELGRKEGIAVNLGNIGFIYSTKGELDKALEYQEKASELNEELGRKEGMARNIGNISIVYRYKGELEKALEYCKEALELNEEIGRKEGVAIQLGNMGDIYLTKGEHGKALEYYEKALKLDKELGRKEGIAAAYGGIGNVYNTKGELEKALEYYEKALKLCEELEIKKEKAIDYVGIGNIYETRGELNKALEYYEKALKIFKEMGSRIETAQTMTNIGDAFAQKGDKKRALDYYHEAKSLAIDSSVFEEISKRMNLLLGED